MADLLLFASEAAAAIGMNPYKKQWETFESVWQRQDPALWRETLEAAHADQEPHPLEAAVSKVVSQYVATTTTTAEVAAVCERATGEVQQAAAQSLAEVANTVEDKEVAATIAAVKTAADLEEVKKTAPQTADVQEALKQAEQVVVVATKLQQKAVSELRCDFGTRLEERSRQELVRSGKVQRVAHDNKFHKKWLGHLDNGRRWGVGGRLDGLDNQGRIVEIKNRTRRFFQTVPTYEMVQVQVYMQMLNVQETVFVQQFDGKQKTTIVARDDAAWESTYLPALAAFAEVVDMVLDEEHVVLRTEWVTSSPDTKEAMLSRWLQEKREAS
jgi:hypothetical protein